MKIIKLALRDFALPSPRTGHIETSSGFGSSLKEGVELHQLVQKKRASENSDYKSEVKISHEFERGGYKFIVEGRIDGLYERDKPLLEEIKSTFNIWELTRVLREKDLAHPYCLQLATYGYIYWLNYDVAPDLSFHLISTRDRSSTEIEYKLNHKLYERWLDARLDELVSEAIRAEKRVLRRKEIASKLPFPFERPRTGQIELINSVEEGLKSKKTMLIQAPTGLGKTIGVLYPSLKEALGRGQRVLYVTPKNSQHSVAEEAVEKFQEKGCRVQSLTLTSKSKMCLKAEPLCNPGYCEYARNYYDKLEADNIKDLMRRKKKLNARIFKNLAKKHEVCPFELQMEALEEMDTVICDYNYVFGNKSALGRLTVASYAEEGKPNLLIDEAHNLPSRAMGYYSPTLSGYHLENMREEIRRLPMRFSRDGEDLLSECLNIIRNYNKIDTNKSTKVELSLEPFEEQDENLKAFLSQYLDSDVEIKAQDVVLRLTFYWSEFTDVLRQIIGEEKPEFFTTYRPDKFGGSLKITCCDASGMLEDKYEDFESVTAFSATLKPFNYYSQLMGLHEDKLLISEFESPYEKSQRKLLIIPQVSTKYSERFKNYSRIADAIKRIISIKKGNYLAFFPSFDFMDQVLAQMERVEGFSILKQSRKMKNEDVEEVLETLRAKEKPTLLFAVQGGVFSEGVDYPGEMLIGAFVVGPPLPIFDEEREFMKNYYEEQYKEGYDYAYTYPAMAKAVQAAGRVIRSESDKGIIVLMDDRFLEGRYTKSMPRDWFQENARELVSGSILNDLKNFWNLN